MVSSLKALMDSRKAASAPQASQQQTRTHGFDDDSEYVSKKGVRLDNTKSNVPKAPPKSEDFRNKVNEIINEENEEKRVGFELTKKYLDTLRNKSLDQTKTQEQRDQEISAVKDLIDFARLINSSPRHEEDDLGTIAVLITLAKALLVQRDRINELDFMCSNLKKEIVRLNAERTQK